MEPINKKGCTDDLYTVLFFGQTVRIYAKSNAQAIQRGIEHFRPNKRERDLITVSHVELIYNK